MTSTSRAVRTAVVFVVAALALSGCGGGEKPNKGAQTPKAAEQTEVPVPPGVTLTEYGTELKFGETARVAYAPNAQRRTVLELTVLSATKGSIADMAAYSLEERTRQSTPYYVQVRVKNVGDGDVGQTPVPLYLVDGRKPPALINPSTFTNTFTKCPSTPLPTTFAPQAQFNTCLVFLAPDHGTMTGVSFRAVQAHAPILWLGSATAPKPTKKAS